MQQVFTEEQNLPCTLYNNIIKFEEGGSDAYQNDKHYYDNNNEWVCEVVGQDAKNIGRRSHATVWVEGMDWVLVQNSNITSGTTTLFAQGAKIANHKLTITSGNPLTFGENNNHNHNHDNNGQGNSTPRQRRRRLSTTGGDLSFLVVRVTTADESLTKQRAEISGNVFGGGGGTIISDGNIISGGDDNNNINNNLKSQAEGCSNNVVTIHPGVGTGSACLDNTEAIFDVPRNDNDDDDDGRMIYNCDWFNDYFFEDIGDLCAAYGEEIQELPVIDTRKTANTECCICNGGRTTHYDNNVIDGVMDLSLTINAVGSDYTEVEVAALNALEDLFYVDRLDELFDNVMLCLPFGTHSPSNVSNTNWVAYASVGGYRSVYNGDQWCANNEVTQLHEIGHNWGLR